MIHIPVVGSYDAETKAKILAGKGGVRKSPSIPDKNKREIFKRVVSIWPGSRTYQIVDGRTPSTEYGEPWYLPIDLGDDVIITVQEFVDMVAVQFGGDEYSLDELTGYLKSLIDTDVDIYKLMVKMGKLN